MVNIHSSSRTFFNLNSVPEINLKWELENVHPLIKELLSSNKVQNVPIVWRVINQRPVINLKHINAFIPNNHFKIEGLQNLRYLIQQRGYIMCKPDLEDGYYCVPLQESSRNYVRFCWSGNLNKFLCLCFSLGPAPRIFTKLFKIPIGILRRINIRIVIYLDDMLLMGYSIEEISLCRDTVIFLLQHLGFVINWKKSVLTPVQEIKFSGAKN